MSKIRRNKTYLNVPAEVKIREAVAEIEKLGADVRLTNAVVGLSDALNNVADYIDEQIEKEDIF